MDVAEVLDRIRSIPPGKVAAYGDVTPGAPRHAGRVPTVLIHASRGTVTS